MAIIGPPVRVTLLCNIYAGCPIDNLEAPAIVTALQVFLGEGLIESSDDGHHPYQTTARGETLIRMLCDTPLPTQVWQDPRRK